jgi:hypothetical protein
MALAGVFRAGVADGERPVEVCGGRHHGRWNRGGDVKRAGSGQTALSAAGETPGHVLPAFTLATELLAEVERLLPRVAEG